MNELNFKNAYYIKLGSKKDNWDTQCINEGTIRIGWSVIKNIDDINNGNWIEIENLIKQDYKTREKNNGAKQDFNALKLFCKATEEDIFITFYKDKMYWCNPSNEPLKRYDENSQTDFTKVRETKNKWKCSPINNQEKIFLSNEIPGQISKTQAYQATFCSFNKDETEIIKRLLLDQKDEVITNVENLRNDLIKNVSKLMKNLFWKDCETLADLIFQRNGWVSNSMKGGSMEFTDMVYVEPINNYLYAVQVKAKAGKKEIIHYRDELTNRKQYKKMYFVIFHPDETFEDLSDDNFEILYGEKLAQFIFDFGLLNWLLKKLW
jgi:hypothetical protein